MPLTWASLEDSIPPLNLLNFPAWQVLLEKKQENKMFEKQVLDKGFVSLLNVMELNYE